MLGMSNPGRKRRGPITLFCESRGFRWAVIVALMLYVPSIGPACWISSQLHMGTGAVSFIYQPVMRMSVKISQDRVYFPICSYCGFGAAPAYTWHYRQPNDWRWKLWTDSWGPGHNFGMRDWYFLGTGAAVGAFAIWLTLRTINRRETWAIVVAVLSAVTGIGFGILMYVAWQGGD
jgi:hypothetical protein